MPGFTHKYCLPGFINKYFCYVEQYLVSYTDSVVVLNRLCHLNVLVYPSLARSRHSPHCRQCYLDCLQISHLSLIVRKPVFGVSDQVPHKAACTATEDG